MLYEKFSKCEFQLQEAKFHGHMISADGISKDLAKMEANLTTTYYIEKS